MNTETELEEIDEHSEEGELSLKQKAFCELYVGTREFFGNGVQSYLEAYDPSRESKNWYDAACVSASRLLSNAKVVKYINNLLEIQGLNDVAVDKQLSFLIAQHADLKTKIAAIKEYNKLKARIVERSDITSGGKPLSSLKELPDDELERIAAGSETRAS